MAVAQDDLFDLPPGVDLTPPVVRCWPDIDTFITDGERRGEHNICILWARGSCPAGIQCGACHRLPSHADEIRLLHSADGLTKDIFGRARGERSERSVVDALQCQTVCVTGLPVTSSQHERRQLLDALGSEWGAVVRTWVDADPRVGYVRFKWRSSAQLFVEAMHGKPARPDEPDAPLELAWCFHDPAAIQATQGRDLALAAAAEARARRESVFDLYTRLEAERSCAPPPAAGDTMSSAAHAAHKQGKRRRGDYEPAEMMSPAEGLSAATVWADAPEERISDVTASYPGADWGDVGDAGGPTAADEAAEEAKPGSAGSGEAPLPDGWIQGIDPASGYTYYYNGYTGGSQWQRPGIESTT
jgi:hypothetical protein